MAVLPPTDESTMASRLVGHLHKLAAAHVGSGHKARHVAHDAAAECHDHVGARKLVLGHKLQNGNIGFLARLWAPPASKVQMLTS